MMIPLLKKFSIVGHQSQLLFLLLILCGCSSRDEKKQLPSVGAVNISRDIKYVGSESCKPCHKDIYKTYMKSEMGRSMSESSDPNFVPKGFKQQPVYDSRLNLYYTAFYKNHAWHQREFRKEKDGTISYERIVSAKYVMGSGNNLRMFFFEEGGMLYQLPLTWYEHKKQFDLSPGFRDFGNVRFTRFASARCISCHNSYLTPDTSAIDRYRQPFVLGIGCERCHGPGELHVKTAKEEKVEDLVEGVSTIINPKKLPFQQQMDVCQQCHLQGKAAILETGKSWFDFRPGELLSSHRSVFFKAQSQQEVFEVGDSPHRLSMSKCFQKSNGKLTCITCHNPHLSINTLSSDYFNSKCGECHSLEALQKKTSTEHSRTSNCISCHMKSTGEDNTLHGVTSTDHWIRIDANKTKIDWTSLRSPSSNPLIRLTAFLTSGDSLSDERLGEAYVEYYREHDARASYLDSGEAHIRRALHRNTYSYRSYFTLGRIQLLRSENDSAKVNLLLAEALMKFDPELYYEIGNMYANLNERKDAIEAYLKAIKQKPNEPRYLEALGIQYFSQDKIHEARKCLEEAFEIDSQNPQSAFILGNIYAIQLSDPAKAISYYLHALTLSPDLDNVHLNLANVYMLQKRYTDAVHNYKLELTKSPKSIAALTNLGKAYLLLGNKNNAKRYLHEALQIQPNFKIAKELLEQL